MPVISGQDLIHSYGERDVLAAVSFVLEPGDRVALVGRNGEGKTTLLRILAGELKPTAGQVQMQRGLRVGYLPQSPPGESDVTLWESCLKVFAELRAMHRQMDALAGELAASSDPEVLRRFGTLQQAFETRDGYRYELRIRTVLTGLGFSPEQYAVPMAQLSGGQRARAMLGRLLLEQPEVLLLDEPTNHLDLEALEWLERWLETLPATLVVVSHDRYFLDKTAQRTWEIGLGKLTSYRGNYSAYLRQRGHRQAEQERIWQAQQEHVAATEEFIRRHHAASRAKEARGRRTRLERFLRDQAIDRPRRQKDIRLRLTPAARGGELVIKARELVVGYDPARPLLSVGDLKLRRGARVAIVGGNGVGKTTLLRTLLGQLPPLRGSAQLGASVMAGHLPQTHDELDPKMTALEAVLAAGAELTPEKARGLLGSLLFSEEEVFKQIGQLSGGQRSRVVLATLAVRGPNLLTLDEPTNHLDLPSQEVLQQVLADFPGTVLLVSHDRYLIDALATEIWAIRGGAIHRLRGRWQEYLRWREGPAEPRRPTERPGKTRAARSRPRSAEQAAANAKRKLQRRMEKLEEQIHALETRLRELSEGISQASVGQRLEEVHRLARQYQQEEPQLKRLWEEWTRLGEHLEQ